MDPEVHGRVVVLGLVIASWAATIAAVLGAVYLAVRFIHWAWVTALP